MRLQEVLKEREAEISALEATLKAKEQTGPALDATERAKPEDQTMHLSLTTIEKFNAVRKSMQLHGMSSAVNDLDADANVDESLDRLNELMLCGPSFIDPWSSIFITIQGYGSERVST